jgi:integrase
MKKVNPIREKKKIKEMKGVLKRHNFRDYILFELGINSGLRISDLLKIKVKDVKNTYEITVREKKTGKLKPFTINEIVERQLNDYIIGMNDEEYLFQSRKGENKPIGRVQAYRVLRNAADEVGLKKIGTHTLRKTFGYWHYKRNKDVAMLQKIFNHSSPSETLDYIGITQEEINKSTREFYI